MKYFICAISLLLLASPASSAPNEPGGTANSDATQVMACVDRKSTPCAHPEIFQAVLGHENNVRNYIRSGYDLNVIDASGWSPLMHAVQGPDGTLQEGANDRSTQRRIVKLLLGAGADVNFEVPSKYDSQSGQRAIDRATWEGDVPMLKILLAAGANTSRAANDPNASILHWSLLQWAVEGQQVDMLRFLLNFPKTMSVGSVSGALSELSFVTKNEDEYAANTGEKSTEVYDRLRQLQHLLLRAKHSQYKP